MARRLRTAARAEDRFPALRAAAAPYTSWPGSLRLDLCRRDTRRSAEAGCGSDCRSVPLRRPGLDRQLSEPGMAPALRRLLPRLRSPLSLDHVLYARE